MPEVTAPAQRTIEGVKTRRGIEREDTTTKQGIPLTTPARTLLSLAEQSAPAALARAVEEAEHVRLFDLRSVEGLLHRRRGQPGTRRLREAIAAWHPSPLLRSDLERRLLEACQGVPQPRVNTTLAGHEVDFLRPEHRLVVELDGPRHFTPSAAARDEQRAAELLARGYATVRLTAPDRATIERLLSTRPGGPAPPGSSSRGS